MPKIFINPGHDIKLDPGAVNNNTGLKEAYVTLSVGEKVANILLSLGYQVKLIQNDNLTDLINQANQWQADAFISIHCNAFTDPNANGTETLYYPNSRQGRLLSTCLQNQLTKEFQLTNRGIKERSDLGVLKQTTMPSALIEMAFITNPKEEQLLATQQQRWANAIARGITDYI